MRRRRRGQHTGQRAPSHAPARTFSPRALLAFRTFGVGIVTAGVLIAGKIALEHSAFGRQFEQAMLNLQQLRLAGALTGRDLSVAVVDITDVPRRPRTGPDDPELVTDRRTLREIVSAIASAGALAIGVDVLLDPPRVTDALTADEIQLLESSLDAQTLDGRRVPVVVGISDGIVRGRARWLGDERFADLAGYVLVPKPTEDLSTTMMVREMTIDVDGAETRVPSMAFALARAATTIERSRHAAGAWLAAHLSALIEAERDVEHGVFTSREFAVNFGPLPSLAAGTVRASSAAEIAASPRRLAGKVVLVGRAQTGQTTDVFTVPAQSEPIAGVYLHAAAAYTLLEAPLFRLTHLGRVAADVVVSLGALTIVFLVLAARESGDAHEVSKRVEWIVVTSVAALVFVVGYFGVTRTGLLWTDCLMVAVALVLHPPLGRALEPAVEAVVHVVSGRRHQEGKR
jgi:CHASE2 domain-containing sensor protein